MEIKIRIKIKNRKPKPKKVGLRCQRGRSRDWEMRLGAARERRMRNRNRTTAVANKEMPAASNARWFAGAGSATATDCGFLPTAGRDSVEPRLDCGLRIADCGF